jgi:hypothetical protein
MPETNNVETKPIAEFLICFFLVSRNQKEGSVNQATLFLLRVFVPSSFAFFCEVTLSRKCVVIPQRLNSTVTVPRLEQSRSSASSLDANSVS